METELNWNPVLKRSEAAQELNSNSQDFFTTHASDGASIAVQWEGQR